MNAISRHSRNRSVSRVAASDAYDSHCQEHKIVLIKTEASGRVYEDILRVRCQANGIDRQQAMSDGDADADLSCAYVGGVAAGTMRVARAQRTRLDCEEYYPSELIEKYRNSIGTASHFAVLQDLDPAVKLAKVMIQAAWVDQVNNGYRVDVINAHERGVSYYQRLGYKVVEGSYFVHPRLGTPSYVLVLVADPNGNSPLKNCFRDVADPVREADLESIVKLTTMKPRRRREKVACAA